MKGATYWKSVLQNQKTTQNGIIDIIFSLSGQTESYDGLTSAQLCITQ